MYIFSEVELNATFSDYIDNEQKPIGIIELNKLNINVGSNNSGKSRFLRLLISKNDFVVSFYNNNIIDMINDFISYHDEYYNSIYCGINGRKFNDGNIQKAYESMSNIMTSSKGLISRIPTNKVIMTKLSNIMSNVRKYHELLPDFTSKRYDVEYCSDLYQKISEEVDNVSKPYNKVYIPTLRSLRNLDYICEAKRKINDSLTQSKMDRNISFDNDFFKGRTLLDYWKYNLKPEQKFVNLNSNNKFTFEAYEKKIGISVFTGLNMFEEITDMLLGEPEERQAVASWEIFLKNHFFDNKNVSITPNRREGIIRIKIGEDEKAIYDLGDGLQTILIITFVMFKIKNSKSILFIEEPELFLHPSYQRKLVEVMMYDDFSNIQYFVTTHSNHFLDLTIDYPDDISIYHFEKSDDKFIITSKSDLNTKHLLNSLGVKPSSMYLSNCIILVEGISDIIYFKKYLEIYMMQDHIKNYSFEKNYSFLEYSGSNIEHWSFLNGDINPDIINPNVFIVADNDNLLNEEEFSFLKSHETDKVVYEENSKKERLIKLFELENTYILEAKEVENLIKGSILREAIISKEKKYNQRLNNERVISDELIPIFDEKDYKNKPIGRFIDKKLKRFRASDNSYTYASSPSGTIINKNEFSKLVTSKINSFDDLTDEAKKLTISMYEFIKKSNRD